MTVATYAVGQYRPGIPEAHVLLEKKNAPRNNTAPGVICVHGHGGNATQFQPANSGPGLHTYNLLKAGYTAISADCGGMSPFGDDDEMTAITAAYNYLINTGKVAGPKVYFLGWSMGGLASLNWIKRNPTLVKAAVVFAPALDLAYFHDTSPNKANYGPEIETDYGGAAGWSAGIVGHSPAAEPQNYRGLPPIHIFHGDADTTVPVSQSQNFVAAVTDPNLTVTVKPGADHVSVLAAVDTQIEIINFFAQYP